MTKSSETRKAKRSPKVLLQIKERMVEEIEKFLEPTHTSQLKNMSAWELADPKFFKPIGSDELIDKIAAIHLQLLPKISGIRALYEGIDEAKVDQATKDGFKIRLKEYVEGLKSHSAFDLCVEYRLGHHHTFNTAAAILMLEKIVLNLHADEIEEEDANISAD